MPIFRIENQLIYYCHVPKAAGTTIEAYLEKHLGELAFVDANFYTQPAQDRWSRCSPQHIDVHSLNRLFPKHFFDEIFTVVRHPFQRVKSVYKFQKLVEKKIPDDVDFDGWVKRLKREEIEHRWAYDNHLLPMHLLIPDRARVFRLEEGLDQVVDYLQALSGLTSSLPRIMPSENVTSARLDWMGVKDETIELTDEIRRHVFKIYQEDFERFGYAQSDDVKAVPASTDTAHVSRSEEPHVVTSSIPWKASRSATHGSAQKSKTFNLLSERENQEIGAALAKWRARI